MRILGAVLLSGLLLATVSVAACSGTAKISDVLAGNSKYEGKEIAIKGTVGETAWLAGVGKGTYQLGDGSGNILGDHHAAATAERRVNIDQGHRTVRLLDSGPFVRHRSH